MLMPDGSVLSFQYTEYYDDVVGILDYTFAEKDGAHGTRFLAGLVGPRDRRIEARELALQGASAKP